MQTPPTDRNKLPQDSQKPLWQQPTALRTRHHLINLSGLCLSIVFTSPMARRTQPGLTISGLMMEPIPSPWKDFKKTLRKHDKQTRQWQSFQMCEITSFIRALVPPPLGLDREPRRATGREGLRMRNGKLPQPPHSSLAVCCSAWKECSLFPSLSVTPAPWHH